MIKVDMEKNKETGITSFDFKCSSETDLETLDCLRVALLGEHAKRGTYVTSNHFQLQVIIPEVAIS